MREIKFRAWDEENKMFHYFTLFDIWKNIKYPSHVITNHKVYHIKGLPIDQYTGLKDKNSKEIYERDIVTDDEIVGEVYWHDYMGYSDKVGYLAWYVGNSKAPARGTTLGPCENERTWEIIGNIYKNPELTEGK